jgi:DNA-binding transcriptional MerR regulator
VLQDFRILVTYARTAGLAQPHLQEDIQEDNPVTDRSQVPTYNMKVVVQETGIKPDTLRAWERRYGLPKPHRSSGRHRLYTEQDIDMLRWFQARQNEGMSIKCAVDLWKQIESEGCDPLLEYVPDRSETALSHPISDDSSMLQQVREGWINACTRFDVQSAQTLLAEAFAIFPAETIVTKLMCTGIREIGERWYEGAINMQQEHFASEIAVRQMESLLASAASLPITQTGKLIVVCPPGELHTFGPHVFPLAISWLLRKRGWDVLYLGANTPLNQLEETVNMIQPRLLIFPAHTLRTASTLLDTAELMIEMGIPLAFGGHIFLAKPELIDYIPGNHFGTNLDEIPDQIHQIVRNPAISPAKKSPASSYEAALKTFRQHRKTIEIQVARAFRKQLMHTTLEKINQDFGDDLGAALRLGKIDWMDDNLTWIESLMSPLKKGAKSNPCPGMGV